jgi:hypothetical protein
MAIYSQLLHLDQRQAVVLMAAVTQAEATVLAEHAQTAMTVDAAKIGSNPVQHQQAARHSASPTMLSTYPDRHACHTRYM